MSQPQPNSQQQHVHYMQVPNGQPLPSQHQQQQFIPLMGPPPPGVQLIPIQSPPNGLHQAVHFQPGTIPTFNPQQRPLPVQPYLAPHVPPQGNLGRPLSQVPNQWSDDASESSITMGVDPSNPNAPPLPFPKEPRQQTLPPQIAAPPPPVQDTISPSSPTSGGIISNLKRTLSRKNTQSSQKRANVPGRSYALDQPEDANGPLNKGNTHAIMALLADIWFINTILILGVVYLVTFIIPGNLTDAEIWNTGCYWKIGWLLPTPYTLICFAGLIMPFRTPRFIYHDGLKKRRCDNLYILTVTRGNNREAVYRSWNAHRHLERLHPSIRVHVLTDEPYFFENINCYTCPKAFSTARSKYKARALDWYRQTMRYTEHDWVLHLDEESVIDDESVRRTLEFIWYETEFHMGQGPILYNQHQYWKNWFFTVADALRVGDDLSRFQLQLTYMHRPIWGCHGSFLLVNGLVENSVTWDLGSLTEDYEFAMAAWARGFKVGKVPGLIREQSPQGFLDFLKQRRRWFVGIFRLKHFLPKLWAFTWFIGSLCLYSTLISIPLDVIFGPATPRWFGLIKNLTMVTFVYLYVMGIFIQDVDKGKNPFLVLLHVPMTIVLQYFAVCMETISVMYACIFPPKDFDVIKK
ncbi:glycosyl transferase family group 2-domain-containing protein [Cladochytrium replicatum]|nr:glycosyl transferase family group 2-domain-containing protein [Cladochytrium replicatum]